MRLLNWLRGKPGRPKVPAAPTEPGAAAGGQPSATPMAVLPEGAELKVYNGRPYRPAIEVTSGGCPLASQGLLTDRMDADLDALLDAVRGFLADGHTPSFSVPRDGRRASDLFEAGSAPSQTSAIVWSLDPRSFLARGGAHRLLKLLQYWIELAGDRRIEPIVYVCPAEPAASVPAFVDVLNQAGLTCRTCGADGTFVLAARRPDGVEVTGLVGSVHARPPGTHGGVGTLFGATAASGRPVTPNDERAQLMYLGSLLRRQPGLAPTYLDWAPALREAMQAAHDGVPDAYPALLQVLRERHVPLLHVPSPGDPTGRGVALQVVDGHTAVEFYPDWLAANAALKDFGLDLVNTTRASIPFHELLGWFSEEGYGIKLWVDPPGHETGGLGQSVLVLPEDVRRLASERAHAADA